MPPIALNKPPSLQPGDTIAVIAPASAPRPSQDVAAGIDHLAALGYKVEQSRATYEPHGYLAGTDITRLDELNGFLRRPDVKALFCVRGGFGVLRLLPYLDYEAARLHPKLLVGYSDITALHCALYQQAGWTGLSGPMVAVEWGDIDPASEHLFWSLVQGATPQPLLGPGGEPLRPMRSGAAEGVLLGGNLTLLTRLIGTPYLPDLEGVLLFIEEVGEQPYRLDGLLAHLKLAGLLERLGGLIIGGLTDWEPDHDRPTLTPEQVLEDYLHDAPYPVATGLVYGHFPIKNTLPFGVRARLEVDDEKATLSILESVIG